MSNRFNSPAVVDKVAAAIYLHSYPKPIVGWEEVLESERTHNECLEMAQAAITAMLEEFSLSFAELSEHAETLQYLGRKLEDSPLRDNLLHIADRLGLITKDTTVKE